ncbi:MAG: hypothetical protein PGN13_07365 [Patulibacter minatonensis]
MLRSPQRALSLAAPLLALAVGASPAAANTYCVPDTTIATDCTVPVGTLQSALDSARASAGPDQIRLAAGTFAGASDLSGDGSMTTITGAGRGQTFITTTTAARAIDLAGNFTVRDLAISGTLDASDIARFQGSALVAERIDVTRSGSGSASGTLVSLSQSTLRDVKIRKPTGTGYPLYMGNGTAIGLDIDDGTGGYAAYVNGGTVTRAKITTGAVNAGVYLTGTGTTLAGALITTSSPNAPGLLLITSGTNASGTVRDTTLVSTAPGTTAPAVEVGTFQPLTAQLGVTGLATAGYAAAGCSGTNNAAGTATLTLARTVATSLFLAACPPGRGYSNAGTESTVAGSGNVLAAPQFANLAGGDYGPLAGGNLVDAGDPASLLPTDSALDVRGNARVVDGNADGVAVRDVGAIEWQVPAATATPAPTPTPAPGTGSPTPAPSPTATPAPPAPAATITSIRFSGTLRAAKTSRTAPLKRLAAKPKSSKVPLVTAALSTPSELAATLARRNAKRAFVTLAGSVKVPKAGTTVRLQLGGTWNGKRLARGTYRLTLKPTGGTARTVQFTLR